MMDVPLTAWLLIENTADHHGDTEVVSRVDDGSIVRHTYAEIVTRTHRLMHALDRMGLDDGDRVGTLAWNGYRHLECYFAVPCTGRVLHTLNLRLSADDLGYIIAHAGDRVVIADADLLPLLEKCDPDALRTVERIIVMGDTVPETSLRNTVAYEDLIADMPDRHDKVDIDERSTLGLCYTSGTTGRPKGVAYTHRSTFLHSLATSSHAAMSLGPQDCVLPVVPMFHANAWGIPHAATAVGAKLVLCGKHLDGASLVELIFDEDVTVAGGVPTIWLACADEFAKRGGKAPALRHIICGGSQPPRPMIERYLRDFGIPIVQAWGMTETSPLASVSWPKALMRDWDEDRITGAVRTQAGLPMVGVAISIRDAEGKEVPADGETMGDLYVRGPWVADAYLHGEGADAFTDDGWFRTGDIAIRSPEGYFVIADRAKDLIKSGGEWISSVDMESDLMAMPEVAEAVVIAIPDPRWQERPLACVVPRPGATVTLESVRDHLAAKGWAKWQLPDRVEILEAIPRTGVGKFDKKVLRGKFAAVEVAGGTG
jgi:fatty-acyl-CoA synthase